MNDAERETLMGIYRESRTIAVVGASADEQKAAFRIRRTCSSRATGFVRSTHAAEPSSASGWWPSLAEVEGEVDVVDVFRPSAEAAHVARQAVAIGAKVLWLQLGVTLRGGPRESPREPASPW